MLRLSTKHFSTRLRDVTNPTDLAGMEMPSPSHEEVKVAIMRLKNHKAAGPDGLPVELFKIGCNVLVGRMRQLSYKIWLEESRPND